MCKSIESDPFDSLTPLILDPFDSYLDEEGEIMGLAQILRQEGSQEECISLVTRLLRRKFCIQLELEQSLAQLQTLPVEKLEDLREAIFDLAKLAI